MKPPKYEVQDVVQMYSALSIWERRALFLILQSMTAGGLTKKNDRMPWTKFARTYGLPGYGRRA